MRNLTMAVIATLVVLPACNKGSFTSPGSPLTFRDNWYPCMGLHIPGDTEEAQIKALEPLIQNGRVQWVRLDPQDDRTFSGAAQSYYAPLDALGVNIMTIIHQTHLHSAPSWIDAFENLRRAYPQTDIWNIAGEITNADPSVNPFGTTGIREYVKNLETLYYYIEERYPGTRLTTPPTFGAGGGADGELEPFFREGMLKMENIVIAINLYTETAFTQYNDVIHNKRWLAGLRGKKIWFTESGKPDANRQIEWVTEMYSALEDAYAPEMICYYSFWEGGMAPHLETGPRNPLEEFGIITDLDPQTGDFTPRPLYNFLLRR